MTSGREQRRFIWRRGENEKVTLLGRHGNRASEKRPLGFRTGREVRGDGKDGSRLICLEVSGREFGVFNFH